MSIARRRSLDPDRRDAQHIFERDVLGLAHARSKGVPLPSRFGLFGRLEHLRQLIDSGNALRFSAGGNHCFRSLVQRVCEVRARGDSRLQRITD